MFKDITAQTGLDFVHSIDPKLHQIRVQLPIFPVDHPGVPTREVERCVLPAVRHDDLVDLRMANEMWQDEPPKPPWPLPIQQNNRDLHAELRSNCDGSG